VRIVGIAAQDWANAGFNSFQALKRYGADAHLLTLFAHKGGFAGKYDIKFWKDKDKGNELIKSADIYVIFESGGTTGYLKNLNLKDNPRVLVVNSSSHYHRRGSFDKLKKHGDIMVGLTANYPSEDIILCSQPVDERLFKVRKNYGQIGKKALRAGAAPFMVSHKKRKGLLTIEKNMPVHYIMGEPHEKALKRILNECDIFTHGIYVAYGYTLVEAAMMAIPCFGSILERDKKYLLLDGEYPIYDIGREGQHIPEMLKFFSIEENRRFQGQKMRRWALEHHSQKAFYNNFTKILKELL
jgi:glycosyltransferase involved in cell wall biosynthesis